MPEIDFAEYDDGRAFRNLLEPWVARTYPAASSEWKRIYSSVLRYNRRKIFERQLKSLAGFAKPVAAHRTPTKVKNAYDRLWREYQWPKPATQTTGGKDLYSVWQDEGLLIRSGGINRMHLELLMHVVDQVRPRSVLEIGFGPGRNLFALAGCFPDIEFAGIELSDAGVAVAKSVQTSGILPREINQFSPRQIVDDEAFRTIKFQQGSADDLPYSNDQFDLIFTRQALEQMEIIRAAVLNELARVSNKHVVMVEPFSDYNQSKALRIAAKKKNHFSLAVDELHQYGLDPIATYSRWPQKIDQGIGAVVATKTLGA